MTILTNDEIAHYIAALEDENVNLEAEVAVLTTENASLRRSVGAFRANATRRKLNRDKLRDNNVVLTNQLLQQEKENLNLKRSVAAYKAAATRRNQSNLTKVTV